MVAESGILDCGARSITVSPSISPATLLYIFSVFSLILRHWLGEFYNSRIVNFIYSNGANLKTKLWFFRAAATGAAYQTGQAGYAVATPVSAAATYGTPRATGYETAYQTPQAYGTPAATSYDYGYGNFSFFF